MVRFLIVFFSPTKSLYPIAPKIFGCVCFAWDVRPHRTKLDLKSLKCIFLSYSRVQKEYRCFCPTLNRSLVSPDVTFFEDMPLVHPCWVRVRGRMIIFLSMRLPLPYHHLLRLPPCPFLLVHPLLKSTPGDLHNNPPAPVLHQWLLRQLIQDQVMIFP